jgi:hypothetical protein
MSRVHTLRIRMQQRPYRVIQSHDQTKTSLLWNLKKQTSMKRKYLMSVVLLRNQQANVKGSLEREREKSNSPAEIATVTCSQPAGKPTPQPHTVYGRTTTQILIRYCLFAFMRSNLLERTGIFKQK